MPIVGDKKRGVIMNSYSSTSEIRKQLLNRAGNTDINYNHVFFAFLENRSGSLH